MVQVTPHMRVLVATEAVDFRRGIDGLACHSTAAGHTFDVKTTPTPLQRRAFGLPQLDPAS